MVKIKNYRLLSFNVYDKEQAKEDEEGGKKKDNKEFTVQMFGLNAKGKTASIFVKGYKPFFYVLVGQNWTEGDKENFIGQIRNEVGEYYEDSILKATFIKRKKLYGFDAGKKYKFLHIKFENETVMKKVKYLWYEKTIGKDGSSSMELSDNGYEYDGFQTRLYEGHIPPLLRMFHIKQISPSGWIGLPTKKLIVHKNFKKTICNYEYTINCKDIIPMPKKETRVPYKICSYDIEASSSHGDFPLAVKNYKKLGQNIVDCWKRKPDHINSKTYMRRIIETAFNICDEDTTPLEDVDIVYPKNKYTSEDINKLFDLFVKYSKFKKTKPKKKAIFKHKKTKDSDSSYDKNNPNDTETEIPMGIFLDNQTIDRETKITEITRALDSIFPKLKGDIVTFIGSTFLRYGEEKPYMNHCIVRDTCSEMPHVENAVLESYKTEKEVLKAWTDLIKRENPDIIIGYNIFGFDYNFMYERSKELGIYREFLKLSRNKNELCLNKDWRTGKETIEESSIKIASGQHDLKYVKMTGRVQIDLYNYLRRDYNLVKYKLDYVASYFIGDVVKAIEYNEERNMTKITTKNLTGLEEGNYITFEEEAHSVDPYKDGMKFQVEEINVDESYFMIVGNERPDMNKKVKWGLAKDDVTPQDIFRMTNEGPDERAIIAKYCIQDCNLVHHLFRKIDVLTGCVEMASLCSVPMDFVILRGQGIKLTSYLAKKCREKETLLPVLKKSIGSESYEGAIVLDPKCDLYLQDPVACVDYSSLYPSSMISENISHDSKVWTKEYDLDDNLLCETGEKNKDGSYVYDNIEEYKYVDIKYDTYKLFHKNNNPKAAKEKVKVGYKICRYAQFPNGNKAILPSILEECLYARKATRKMIPLQTDPFMKNVLDKRQLTIKILANSIYGQCGAKTSTFYEIDVAASTTAIGRKLLTYGKLVIEEAYKNKIVDTKNYGKVKTNAEYVYGDTDSVFFKFNLEELDGTKIVGKKALEITIELAIEAGELASKFLKNPHDLEYEKTFMPFCLLSKKRYVGMLYENDPNKCYRKSMGIVLKRRDNAPIVKDVYGGIIDILMKEQDIEKACSFLKTSLNELIQGNINMDKLVITKSLRGDYKNPDQIAHKVLADRIGKRDPGNKPAPGDRIAYIYFVNSNKKALQGEKIETPTFIMDNRLKIDYTHYITNQIMKPVQQLIALVLEDIKAFKKKKGVTLRKWNNEVKELRKKCGSDEEFNRKLEKLRNKEVKALLFDSYLREISNRNNRNQSIKSFYRMV